MRRAQSRQAGFTLLEMLVAMTLLSLILSSFGTLFYRLAKTNAAIGRIEQSENVDVVRRYLQQSLEGMRAYAMPDQKGGRTVRFEGERSRVVFVGLAAGDRETGGLYQTELWLDPQGRLQQRRQPLGWGQGTKVTPEVLLEGVESLTLSYFSCPDEGPQADVHHWADARRLPFLISADARFSAGDRREWRAVSAFTAAAACGLGT